MMTIYSFKVLLDKIHELKSGTVFKYRDLTKSRSKNLKLMLWSKSQDKNSDYFLLTEDDFGVNIYKRK